MFKIGVCKSTPFVTPKMLLRAVKQATVNGSRRLSQSHPCANFLKDREAGEEIVHIKKHEAEQLRALREKLVEQQKQLGKLQAEVENVVKEHEQEEKHGILLLSAEKVFEHLLKKPHN